MTAVAIDIGGSSIKSALVDDEGPVPRIRGGADTHRLESKDFPEIEHVVVEICRRHLAAGADPRVGISTAGFVDSTGTVVSGKISGYQGVRWAEILRSQLGDVRVRTVNDGWASAWGEYIVRTTKPWTHVHVVVGTGVGGGVVLDGRLLRGALGDAGSVGHMKVTGSQTIMCSCGERGCVETLASSRGIVAAYSSRSDRRLAQDGLTFESLMKESSSDPETISQTLHECGYWLGVGIGNAMNILNPQVVTIGGGVVVATSAKAGERGSGTSTSPYLRGVMAGARFAAKHRVLEAGTIEQGTLGNDAGLIGAASLLSVEQDGDLLSEAGRRSA